MTKLLMILVVLVVALMTTATIAGARVIERNVPMIDDPFRGVPLTHVFGVNSAQGADTFWYGGTDTTGYGLTGTYKAAVPTSPGWVNRKMWTWSATGFNGVPHSGFFMDGWRGVDNTTQAEDYFHVASDTSSNPSLNIGTCVLAGHKSLFCGVTNGHYADLCYADQNGTGYGNSWKQVVATQAYTYATGNQIALSYRYHNESEPGYDFTDIILQRYDTVAGEWVNYDTLREYTDALTGIENIDLDSYMASLTPPVQFRIMFHVTSDGGYSDEDGYFPTSCGEFLLDDYDLHIDTVAADSTGFEEIIDGGLPVGWQKLIFGSGDLAHVRHINDLPIGLYQDPCMVAVGPAWCEIADSVLVFYDETTPGYPHPFDQDNYAMSPVIDFSDHTGLPGRILHCERFGSLPRAEFIFMFWQVRYAPGCESGGWSPWMNDHYVYYTPEGVSCRPMDFDVSSFIPPTAEKAQAAYGVINYCDEWMWGGPDCTYTCNVTPYFDNVSLGVYGSDVAPYVSMRELDYWQDQFTEDGTLNPTSTADTRTSNYLSNLYPPIFGDTMTCRGGADNTEVYLVFRMAKIGPRQPVTAPFFTAWFPIVTTGAWQEARMDTTEVTDAMGTGKTLVQGRYMSTFHESDPIRMANPGTITEGREMLPNNLFVPGTRILYFVKARYVGSGDWFLLPDTTIVDDEEFEILPMYRDDGHGGLRWPCLIVADHFGQRGNWFERNSDRIGAHLAANGYEYDMFSKLGPTSDLRNSIGRTAANPGQLGGPGTDKYNWGPGATLTQFMAYTHCLLNSGTQLNNSMNESDVTMINSWLTVYTGGDRFKFFWASGDQLVRWLYNQAAWGRPFINNILGSTYVHWNYAIETSDYTYCLPLNVVAGGRLADFTTPMIVRSNGCTRTYTVLGVSGSTPGAKAERQYDTQPPPPAPGGYASVSNQVFVVGGANYYALSEGYDNCAIRTDGSLGYPACGNDNVLTNWLNAVLGWASYFGTSICTPGPVGIDPYSFAPPAVVTSLAAAYPNPMNPTATIWYTVGAPGKVTLKVFDVKIGRAHV